MCKCGRISVKCTREVAACHYVCVNAFVFVFIRQTFWHLEASWGGGGGFEAYCLHPSVCAFVCTQICEWRWWSALKACLAHSVERRGGFCSKIKLDLDQHVEFLAVFSPLKMICILIVYLIKLNLRNNIVYYSQGTNIQLSWHMMLCEYENLAVSKFDSLPSLILTHIYSLSCFMFFFPFYFLHVLTR